MGIFLVTIKLSLACVSATTTFTAKTVVANMPKLLRPCSAGSLFSPLLSQVLIEGFDPDKFRAANAVRKSSSLEMIGGFDANKFRAANAAGKEDKIVLKRRKSTG